MSLPDSPDRHPEKKSQGANSFEDSQTPEKLVNSRPALLDALSQKSNTPDVDDLKAVSAFLRKTYLDSDLLKEADIEEFSGALETLMNISVFGGEDDEQLFKQAAQSIRKLVGMIKGRLRKSRSVKRPPKMHHKPSISDTGRISVESLVEGAGSQQNPASIAVELLLKALQKNESLSSRFFEVEGKAMLDIRGPLSSTFRWLLRALSENIDITIESGVSAVAMDYSSEELEWIRNDAYNHSLYGFASMKAREKRTDMVEKKVKEQLRITLEEFSIQDYYPALIDHIDCISSGSVNLSTVDQALLAVTDMDKSTRNLFVDTLWNNLKPNEALYESALEASDTQLSTLSITGGDTTTALLERNHIHDVHGLNCSEVDPSLYLLDETLQDTARSSADLTVEEFKKKRFTALTIKDHESNVVIDGARVSFLMQETGESEKRGKANPYLDASFITKFTLPQMKREGVESVIFFGNRDFKLTQEIAVIPVDDKLLSLTPDAFQQVMNTFLHRVVNRTTIRVKPREFTFRLYSLSYMDIEVDSNSHIPGSILSTSPSLEWKIGQNRVNKKHVELDFNPAECEGYSLRDCLEKLR